MRKTPRTPFHAVRSGALAAGTLTLAAGAHFTAGGSLPAPGILLALLALTVLACTAATRLRLGLPAVMALLGGGQLALHEALTLLSTAGTSLAATGTGHAAGAPGHAAHGLDLSGTLAHAAGHVAAHVSPADPAAAPIMLAAHALATLGCALLLAQGENALWQLAAWLRPLAEVPGAAVVRPVPKAPAAFPSTTARPRPWRNLRQHSRRGPPSAAVSSA